MKIVVRAKADEDLDSIFAWIARDNPRAAAGVIRRIRQRIGRLATPGLEHMGRPDLILEHASSSSRPTSSSTKCTKRAQRSKCSTSCTAHRTGSAEQDSARPCASVLGFSARWRAVAPITEGVGATAEYGFAYSALRANPPHAIKPLRSA